MAGKRQDTQLVILNGRKHLTKAETAARLAAEPKKIRDKQVWAPDWMPPELRPAFNDLRAQLTARNLFEKLDRDTLARYLVSHTAWLGAIEYATKAIENADVESAGDWTGIADKYFKQCRVCACDLGLNITARCRLVLPPAAEEEEVDPMTKLFERRHG
ncbi:MAG: phage terminase small subunit P27 family [Oscillospiraceae bacterium]